MILHMRRIEHHHPYHLISVGTFVSLTSVLSTKGSNFTAVLDGVSSGPYSLALPDNSPDPATPTIVYSVSNLVAGRHNLTLSKTTNASESAEFYIDSFA